MWPLGAWPLTVVVNLATGEARVYAGLLNAEALRHAWFQARGDHSWWVYHRRAQQPLVMHTPSGRFVNAGDWCVATNEADNEALLRRYVYPVWARLDAQEVSHVPTQRPHRPARRPRPARGGHSLPLPGL